MGVGMIISRGGGHYWIFSKIFQGSRSDGIWFYPLKTKKTIFC